ncbi:MAG: polyprenyl synthetase family protein, partial [Actinobacteria bacterium]|nr:polyprenyl synthetase family protein [Actinomycetota bacterium]
LRALELAGGRDRGELVRILDTPGVAEADAERAREIVLGCGALSAVERLVDDSQRQARRALAGVLSPAREALEDLADLAVFRVT